MTKPGQYRTLQTGLAQSSGLSQSVLATSPPKLMIFGFLEMIKCVIDQKGELGYGHRQMDGQTDSQTDLAGC